MEIKINITFANKITFEGITYELYALVIGTTVHSFVYCKEYNGKWNYFNDDVVTPILDV